MQKEQAAVYSAFIYDANLAAKYRFCDSSPFQFTDYFICEKETGINRLAGALSVAIF
ncbi:MAG: hypothetical protein WC566_02065 [Dehalococcoidia bacterium]